MNKTSKHIGIIGCSYEGAALCYQTICNEGSNYLGPHAHPEVSLHTHPLQDYMAFIYKDKWQGVADLMVSSAKKLEAIGAEVLVCPDNTIHKVYAEAKLKIDIPWLHIAEEVSKVASDTSFKKVGVLGTKYLMESQVYPTALGAQNIAYEIPDAAAREQINSIIFDELVYGMIMDPSRDYLKGVIMDLGSKGCDSVVLGCTEIPLIINDTISALPTLDSTRILARAALTYAIE
ncbi:MAG: amino acid racemase [Flavobacteriaceae bacterium]|nr:amino acid racemase [Flavobacteriaceae bacterium]